MSVPVRTNVLNNLITAFESIDEIAAVYKFQPAPVDISTVETPALYLYEIDPEDRDYSNRVAIGRMHLFAQVYIEFKMHDSKQYATFSDLSDIIQCRLHNIFYADHGLRGGIVKITEMTYDRVITQDGWGILSSKFDLEYRHDFGNGFS